MRAWLLLLGVEGCMVLGRVVSCISQRNMGYRFDGIYLGVGGHLAQMGGLGVWLACHITTISIVRELLVPFSPWSGNNK